jgi:iron complex outermembrane recepter protein
MQSPPHHRSVMTRRATWLSILGLALFMVGMALGSDVETSEPAVSSPAVPDSAAPSDDTELNLDALLDLAERDPTKLQSISVKDPSKGLTLSPEAVFRPDMTSSGAGNSTGSLLSQAPGVVLRSTSALNQDVRLRGYSGSQVVGVADGMNQIKSRLDIDSLFSQIDPTLVDSVAVISGPYAVEFGPGFAFFDARLITPGRASQPTSHSRSLFGFNTNGGQIVWRETAEYADQTSGVLVSFGQRIGNDYQPGGQSNDYRVPASYNVRDLYVAASQDVTARSRLDVSYLRQVLQSTELPGVAYDIDDQHADQLNLRWRWRDDAIDADRFEMQMWWNQAAFLADASHPSKQQTFVERFLGEPYPDMAGGGTLQGHGLSDNWGARAISYWGDRELWLVSAGLDWRRVRQVYRELDFQADGSLALMGDTYGIPDSSADDFGAFVSGTAMMTENWSVRAGQRLDWVAYSIDPNDIVATSVQFSPNDEFFAGFNTDTRTLSSTYLLNTFEATDTLSFNAGAAFAMRPPNLTELYSDQPFAPLIRFGNSYAFGDSDLDSEKNLQFDLGVTSRHEQTTLGARAFHSTIRDYIGLAATNYGTFPELGTAPPGDLGRGKPYMVTPGDIPELSSDTASLGYVYRNIDRVTLYGFDLLAEQQLQPWLELAGTLTFTEGINHDPTWVDVYTGEVHRLAQREGLYGIYPINSTVSLRFVEPVSRKWTLEWQSRFARHQEYLATSLGEIGTPGFAVYNVHASYRWTEHISLRSSLLNVFDRNYYEHNSLAIIDRNGDVTFVKNPGISWFFSCEVRY